MSPWAAPLASGPLDATLIVPGSKSATARAYVLAALSDGPGAVYGALTARDTDLMRGALSGLGVVFEDHVDHVLVTPPAAFTAAGEVDCGLSGTVMRFVPPLAATAEGLTRFVGDPAAADRPMAPLLSALCQLGAQVSGDRLPFTVAGGPIRGGRAYLDASGSSQFVSGLLLVGARLPDGLDLVHRGPAVPSQPHIGMTIAMLARHGVVVEQPAEAQWRVSPGPVRARTQVVEPDLTTAATLAAAALVAGGTVSTPWPDDSDQAADELAHALAAFGAELSHAVRDGQRYLTVTDGRLRGAELDLSAISEFTCAAAALAVLAEGPSRISGVAHIRGHETDRLRALAAELTALGADVRELQDGLEIKPGPLSGGEFHTCADHRMAHAGALIGLVTPGISLDDVDCTSKTLPEFPTLWPRLVGAAE